MVTLLQRYATTTMVTLHRAAMDRFTELQWIRFTELQRIRFTELQWIRYGAAMDPLHGTAMDTLHDLQRIRFTDHMDR